MKEINLPPYAPLLMESTRALGYSLEAAIADLIDNSITATSTKINIKFLPFDDPFLSIFDNGDGMLPDELTIAMRYGSKNPTEERKENDLGRFGLGLKTASLSQCRKLTVVTMKEGMLSGRQWNLDHVINTGEWSLLVLEDDEMFPLPQVDLLVKNGKGTVIIWQNLDRLGIGEYAFEQAFGDKMEIVRDHLSLVFHRYLAGEIGLKKIEISINNNAIIPHDPFLSHKSLQVMDDENINIDNQIVVVRAYLLPHITNMTEDEIKLLGGKEGLRKQQGFYVYRNKRLLVWGTWFRLMRQSDLSKLARVRVDISNSLDHLWTLDIRKSTAVPPEIVRKNLTRIIGQISEKSKRTWTFRGKKEMDDAIVHVWNRLRTRDGIKYIINRDYPLIFALKLRLDSEGQRYLEQLLKMVELNIPLNSIYIDLANDERMTCDDEEELKVQLKELLRLFIDSIQDVQESRNILDTIRYIEPFSQYSDLMIDIMGEEE